MSTTEAPERVIPRRLVEYREKAAPALREQFGYTNPMQVPRLTKIVVNMGIGRAVENKARIEHATKELAAITGQKPTVRNAKHAIASFKIRENYPIGAAVTLRGSKMWEFYDRLVSIAIPRIRDFRGMPKKFDGRGNYSVGLSEQSIFPEISLDRVEFVQGMNITFVTTAKTDEEGLGLLQHLGFPFRK
jgi:large subunit ribosomal protein L5